MIFTSVNRLENSADYPLLPGHGAKGRAPELCPSGDELSAGARCFHDNYVAGVDGRWRSPSGDYVLSGQAIGTLTHGGPPRTMADGTVVKSGDLAPAVVIKASKDGGKHVTAVAEYEVYGNKVDYNDLGFMPRQNLQKVHAAVEIRTLEPRGASLETQTFFDFQEQDNLALQNQSRVFTLGNYAKFKNFWKTYAEIHFRPAHFDDREVGDGTALQRGALIGAELWGATDPRQRVYGELWTQVRLIDGGYSVVGDGKVSVKVLPQWDVDLIPSLVHAVGEPRYFATQGDAYLFGRQRAQSLSLTLRSTYTFTPRLTLQAYAQAIVEAVHYADPSSVPTSFAGRAVRLADLRPHPGPIAENPDYRAGTINASLVLRWEYRMGSTLYVVYTHAQSDDVTPPFGDPAGYDFRLIRPRAAEDALLAKLSYWWG